MAGLQGKVVLITGASSGIGRGTALHFATLGCRLSLNGRNHEELERVVEECKLKGLPEDKVHVIPGDLTNAGDAKNVIQKTVDRYGHLNVLINSAGILSYGTVENISLEDYDFIMNINCRSILHMMQLAIPHLKQTKGNIVNVSSVTGLRAFPGIVSYNMSKGALDQLTRTAALELAPHQVRVNSVNPGVIITEVHRRGGLEEEAYQQFLEHSKATHALGRVGTVDEVAKTIAFLASDDASFITGTTMPVDGGRSVMCPR